MRPDCAGVRIGLNAATLGNGLLTDLTSTVSFYVAAAARNETQVPRQYNGNLHQYVTVHQISFHGL